VTTLIALCVLVIWWIPVFMKKSQGANMFLSCQTLFAIGFTLQFVLPAIYFDYFPYYPDGYADMTPFYPTVIFMPLIAGIPFFLLSLYDRRKINILKNFSQDLITKGEKIPLPITILITILFLGGLVGKYFMIKTGSFYHIYRTSYQFDYYEYYVIITILSDYFIISGLFLLAIGIKKKQSKYILFGYIIVIIELIFGIISGKRRFVGQLIIQYFTLRIACGKTPRIFNFAIICLLFFLMVPVMEIYSGYIVTSNISESTLLGTKDLYDLYKSSEEAAESYFTKIMFRFGDIRGASAAYSTTPDMIDFQYGQTYKYIPFFLIPRIIWPDKPDSRELANYTKIAMPSDPGSAPISWVCEGYLNFSWFGVFLIGCVMALISRKLDNWLIPRVKAYIVFAVIWAYFSYNLILVCYSMSYLVTEFLRLFIYFYPFYIISRFRVRP
jgi:oligosaccharide repeat unit polymerase